MKQISENEYFYIRCLQQIEGIGTSRVIQLIKAFDSAENVFSVSSGELVSLAGFNEILAGRIVRFTKTFSAIADKVKSDYENMLQKGIQVYSFFSEGYPDILRNIYLPPILLYVDGFIDDSPAIGIVGTRTPTGYGKILAERFAKELTLNNITIVSGFARGIDSIAHKTAASNGGKTIAVLGSGIDVIYPAENKPLYEEIRETGAVISEFDPGTKPDAQNFPKRNRIISGLSKGVLLIESTIKGGAMRTASYALDQNREVYAVPGNIVSVMSDGPNYLIKRSEAKLVMSVSDILEDLLLPSEKIGLTPNLPEMDCFEARIFDVLSDKPKHIDNISDTAGISLPECLGNLLSLELKGAVSQLPGKYFIRTPNTF